MSARRRADNRSNIGAGVNGTRKGKRRVIDDVPQSSGEFEDFDDILGREDSIAPAKGRPSSRAKGVFTTSGNYETSHEDGVEMSFNPEAFYNHKNTGDTLPRSSRHPANVASPVPPSSNKVGYLNRLPAAGPSRYNSRPLNGNYDLSTSNRQNDRSSGNIHARLSPVQTNPGDEDEVLSPDKKGRARQSASTGSRPSKRMKMSNGKERDVPRTVKKPKIALSSIGDAPKDDGVRRSRRVRYEPLEWWRLEKAVYGLHRMGDSSVPHIREIIRLPKEPARPLSRKHRRPRQPRHDADDEGESDAEIVPDANPEEGLDDETQPIGTILDYAAKQEVDKRIICTRKMLQPKAAANEDFFFQRVFEDGDFMAAGYLQIPPGKAKPTKATKDNTYAFYVIEGAVNFKAHKQSFVIASGGMFLAPRGNTYYIENISDREAKIFFAQARKVPVEEEEDEAQLLRLRNAPPAERSTELF